MALDTQVVDAEQLIVKHLELWTSAQTAKSTAGRGSNNKIELTGIKKLRELILELAVRGKLVPQDPNDEPASELIKRIAKEKDALAKAGKISKPKSVKAITEVEMPFDLPKGWAWARLPDTYYSISPSGKTLKTSEILQSGEYPVVDQGQKYISGYSNDASLCLRLVSPVIVFGDHTKNIKHVDFDFVAGADGTKILCPILISSRYFYYGLLQFDLDDRGYGRHFKILNDKLFAIPPLNEQLRIVAALEALMALCDKLEQQSYQSIDAHNQLVDTLLQTLVDSTNADELASNWQRLSEHFDTLFTTEYSIDALKQTILQLAVMGKLVKQDPTDEPASELLKRIAKEKEALVKAVKIKKQKPLSAITDAEKPFELPEGWEWVRFGELFKSFTNGLYKHSSFYKESGVISLRMYNIQNGHIDFDGTKRVELSIDELEQFSLEKNDLLINRVNSKELVGKSAIIPQFDEPLVYESMNMRAKPFTEFLSSEYLNLFMMSKFAKNSISQFAKEAIGQASINQAQVSSIVTPLPPLSSQRRIVSKHTELMDLCDALADKLSENEIVIAHFANTLVEKVVA